MAALNPNEIIMNAQGLVVNSFQDAEGRGAYFSGSSGTSEGQFLFILGMLDAYRANGNRKALAQAQKALGNVLQVLYRNMPVPSKVTALAAFAPHWLFSAKYAFNSTVIRYSRRITFTNGVGVIPAGPNLVRTVFNVRSLDAEYLWENPYSVLKSGRFYPIASTSFVTNSGQRINLIDGYTGDLLVTYSVTDGPVIAVNELYEAWPDWRKLDPTEIDAACDVFIWAWRAFSAAYELTGEAIWREAARATLEQAQIANDINDSRDWLKPTWSDSAFSEGARFSFVDRLPAPSFTVAAGGIVQIGVPTKIAGTGEVQYGKASLMDVYGANDTTTVEIGSSRAMEATVYIDQTATYAPERRWSAVLNLNGTGAPETFQLDHLSFGNESGRMPANTPVYSVGISTRVDSSFTMFIRRVRQNPALSIPYYPGAIPFTANFAGNPPMLIDWRGPVYAGYQAPEIWMLYDDYTGAQNCLQLLKDAQDAWVAQTGKPRGPFAPVFYFARDDAVQYGPKNSFGWDGPDPNTIWGGYQYRPLAEAAETVWRASKGTVLYVLGTSVAEDFLTYLANNAYWPVSPVQGPPTDFPKSGSVHNYDEPHMAALIWRAVIKMDWKRRITSGDYTGIRASHQALMDKCEALYDKLWVTTGIMAGTFSNNPSGHEWFGFWHGEILSTLALVRSWADLPQVNNAVLREKCDVWINGLVRWSVINTSRSGGDNSPDTPAAETTWPFTPDWVDGMTESWEFQTNIMTSFDGTEQRRGLRQSARRRLTLAYTLTGQREAADFQATLSARLNKAIYIPQWHIGSRLRYAGVLGDDTIFLNQEADSTITEGVSIVIDDGTQQHSTWVRWVSGSELTIKDPLPSNFAVNSRVAVCFAAVIDPSIQSNRLAAQVVQASIGFQMLPQNDQRVLPTIATPLHFIVDGDTREVVTIRPNWAYAPSVEDTWLYTLANYTDGPITPMSGENFGRRTIKATFTQKNAAERRAFEGLLRRLRGRQRACWVSSWMRDFEMTGETGTLNTLRVQWNAFVSEGLLDKKWMGICIHRKDGVMMPARVKDSVKQGDNVTLTLDRNLDVAATYDNVAKISALYRVRQASDLAEIKWHTETVSECSLSFITVKG